MRKFYTKWVLKCLNADQKRQRFQESEQILEISRCDPKDFPSRLVTIDETLLYRYDPRQNNNQCSGGIAAQPDQKFRVQNSVGTCLDIFWIKIASSSLIILQRGVLLISAGAFEGDFWGKNHGEVPQRDFELTRQCPGSPGTCYPKETGITGLPLSWSSTLFYGSGPVGITPVLWTEETIEISPFFVRSAGRCCRGDLFGRTNFWFFFVWLAKVREKC